MSRLTFFFWAAASLAPLSYPQSLSDEVYNPHTTAADVAQGEKTFRSHCSPCHGFRGEGGRGPNLASGVFFHGSTDADLLRNISEGVAGTEMPGLFYSPDRVWQVVAYIRSLNSFSATASTANIAAGKALFAKQGCSNCHRVNGAGSAMGPDLTEIGKSRSTEHLRQAIVDPNADVRPRYWVVHAVDASGQKYEGFLLNEDTYSVQFIDFSQHLHSLSKSDLKTYDIEKTSRMPSYRDKLSDEQVSQLVAYLSSLRPAGELP
ncbi:MAG: c-type cytochrome [Acidobacteriaceae bacterium]|nr:c-type cytochrome [Acidobacteriaceae bacterium]